MTERPILFSGPMVKAILEDRKGQTRRVIKSQPWTKNGYWYRENGKDITGVYHSEEAIRDALLRHFCPYAVGMHLWVRETWHIEGSSRYGDSSTKLVRIAYRPHSDLATKQGWAQGSREFVRPYEEIVCGRTPTFKKDGGIRWFPGIHMPRWASRITLEIKDIRVQRLQEISEEDAKSEGFGPRSSRALFRGTWEDINGKRKKGIYAWVKNPFVWAITFRRITL